MEIVKYIKNAENYKKTIKEALKDYFFIDDAVCVKLHMGQGKGYFDPYLAELSVKALKEIGCKPFLFDTTSLYPGPRYTPEDYIELAREHGFTEENIGCRIVVDDFSKPVKTDNMEICVASQVANADKMLVLSHVKGHMASGFGASIKNIAMGCVDKKTKQEEHSAGKPDYDEANCTMCQTCVKACPFDAIHADNNKIFIDYEKCWGCDICVDKCPEKCLKPKNIHFGKVIAEACWAVIETIGKPNIFCVNDIRNVTKNCDCFSDPGEKIIDDIGIVIGRDIVSVDKAAFDLINKRKKDLFKKITNADPSRQILEAEKLELGSILYKIEEI